MPESYSVVMYVLGVVGVKKPRSWHSVEQILQHVEKSEGSTVAG